MTLETGRNYMAIPGPSVMPDAVLRAMHRAAPNIYDGEIVDLAFGLLPDLKQVAQTKHKAAIYIGNGHAAWEAALSNVLIEGDKVLLAKCGMFGRGWGEMAEGLGVELQALDFGSKTAVDPAKIAEALAADKGHKLRAVLCTHVDTSSSLLNDIAAIRAAIDSVGHPALLMVDCIASMGCDRFEMDAWGVDVAITASQKGLMVPPGLAIVFYNEKAEVRRREIKRVSRYWDWTPRGDAEFMFQMFCGTAPTHHLYGLRAALDMIRAESMQGIWQRHDLLARAIWAACEAWGQGGPMALNVADPAQRSRAVTALHIGKDIGTPMRRWVQNNAGLVLGIGLGMSDENDPDGDGYFRIGHMGHVNVQMVMGMLGSIETALTALDAPHGRGAIEAAAEVIAAG